MKTWDDAAELWLVERADKRTISDDNSKINWLSAAGLRGIPLSQIDRRLISDIAARKLKESSPSTANRYSALVRAILRRACIDWGWIDRTPKVRMFKEPPPRKTWFTKSQVSSLLEKLPAHQRNIVLFALATGLRQSNVARLRWDSVDRLRSTCTIAGIETKNGETLTIPLNDLAMAILDEQAGLHPEWVFVYRGRGIRCPNTRAWRNALKQVGLAGSRWHDLRHTWASWHIQSGTPLNIIQELGGWKSQAMVQRYAHLDVDHLRSHAQRITFQIHG